MITKLKFVFAIVAVVLNLQMVLGGNRGESNYILSFPNALLRTNILATTEKNLKV